jgi:lysine 2,3-aminomutase
MKKTENFWQQIPAYKDVDASTFASHKWQEKNSVTSVKKLMAALGDSLSPQFLQDVQEGFQRAPMAVRISPYLISLIDWQDPVTDPIRRQFLPMGSQLQPDHPMLTLDSLHEQADAPVPGLTHRYPDKVLFLALDTCPVYCRFCTRSYAVGLDTEEVEKMQLKANKVRWKTTFDYIRNTQSVRDVVVSGGDAYRLKADQIREIGYALLDVPHVARFRFATKGLAIQPQKILTDSDWVNAIAEVTDRARLARKEVCIHTHFNHPREITSFTQDAAGILWDKGIKVRNQTVLQRGVNDDSDVMTALVRSLSDINVQPYYVYVHDLVRGTEDLRTSVEEACQLERHVRGTTAGFNTPTFVVDAPGGGGKRCVHSYDSYDRETGISVWSAPGVKPGKKFLYFDPMRSLSKESQERWKDSAGRQQMLEEALK